jgi:photosystem II stability/assembly factor-like uncharacterized protein
VTRILASTALLLLGASAARAQEWQRQTGPFGGTVLALDTNGSGAIHALRGDTLFRTTDGGAHWVDVGPQLTFTFLALDVTPSGAIWTGTSSRGVAWSLNGGQTWTNNQIVIDPHTGLGATIIAIGVDPAGRILAGSYRSANGGATFTPMTISGLVFTFDATGGALAGTTDGVWRSSDGGASWTPANAGMAGERVEALATDGPAGIWAGTGDGDVWRSTDAGLTWTPDGSGLPGAGIRAIEILPGRALAATRDGGLFATTDGGFTWNASGANPGEIRDLQLAGGDLWIAATGHGVFVSSDGGATAAAVSAAEMHTPGLSDLAGDAGGTLYLASTGSGVFRSTDGGATWSPASDGLGSLFVSDVAAASPGRAWAATWPGLFATTDAGDSWMLAAFAGLRTHEIIVLPGDLLIASVENAQQQPTLQRSTDAGATWTEVWSSPFVFRLETSAVTSDGTVLVGGMAVFGGLLLRSTDDGATWSETPLGTAGIEALAAGPDGLAWAAVGDNVVHRSTDHGAGWSALPNGGWPTGTVGSVTALERAPEGLFLVGTGDVYRSTDDGDTWDELGDGFPADAVVSFLVSAPSGVFAGTSSSGVFRFGTATDVSAGAPRDAVALLTVAPNPFRAVTRVSWDLPRPAFVRVAVHDVRGRRVAELSPGLRPAGPGAVTWDGTAAGGDRVAPGTYFVRWEADGRSAAAKVLRLR